MTPPSPPEAILPPPPRLKGRDGILYRHLVHHAVRRKRPGNGVIRVKRRAKIIPRRNTACAALNKSVGSSGPSLYRRRSPTRRSFLHRHHRQRQQQANIRGKEDAYESWVGCSSISSPPRDPKASTRTLSAPHVFAHLRTSSHIFGGAIRVAQYAKEPRRAAGTSQRKLMIFASHNSTAHFKKTQLVDVVCGVCTEASSCHVAGWLLSHGICGFVVGRICMLGPNLRSLLPQNLRLSRKTIQNFQMWEPPASFRRTTEKVRTRAGSPVAPPSLTGRQSHTISCIFRLNNLVTRPKMGVSGRREGLLEGTNLVGTSIHGLCSARLPHDV